MHRHPQQTLDFFGVEPGQTVIEITPGGGWYAEILAPYLRDDGHYVAAVWDDAIPGQPKYRYDLNKSLRAKFAGNTAVFGTPDVRVFDPKAPVFGAANAADVVLTFRNAHNWVGDGNAEAYFSAFFTALKPGGVLGVVDHRAKPGTDLATMKKSGYLTEALVIELAQGAGFVLEGQERGQRQSARHRRPPQRRVDAAAIERPRSGGRREVQGDRRKRPDDAAVPQAAVTHLFNARVPCLV